MSASVRLGHRVLLTARRFCNQPGSVSTAQSEHWWNYIRACHANAPSLRFCVVGAGPAGFYTTDKLLKAFPSSTVDLVDRLPSPYGLVRSGVAPDHQSTKAVVHRFEEIASSDRVQYFGNVRVGQDVSVHELHHMYNGVVFAYGAESDRRMNIPGEDLGNVFSAREFVWWYNGHPDYKRLPVKLEHVTSAVVIGLGNVAIDCARVLLRNRSDIQTTDIASHASAVLAACHIKEVHIVGRRGPLQAKFTNKELRELLHLDAVSVHVRPEDLRFTAEEQAALKGSRQLSRMVDILTQMDRGKGGGGGAEGDKHLDVHFFLNPVELLPANDNAVGGKDRVGFVRLEHSKLENGRMVRTGVFSLIPCQLVLKSVGYKSLPLPGLPFDENKGIIPNIRGQVIAPPVQDESLRNLRAAYLSWLPEAHPLPAGASAEAKPVPGLFVCGWLKRGPTGIIGSNIPCADETVATIVEEARAGRLELPPTPASSPFKKLQGGSLTSLLQSRRVQFVDFAAWERVDAEEVSRGTAIGKIREKIVDVPEMLAWASLGR